MKKSVFRPAEFWRSAVMTMPDASFFELLRSVFGKIKTPFNKQQLVKDLEMFLLREDIQKTIASYINENDAKVIAAAALFGEPLPSELESFFSGELSYAQLHDIIVNLEERFILYRFKGENSKTVSRLALNPVLETVLLPLTEDISQLFPAVPKTDVSAQSPHLMVQAILNDRIIAGLLSFVCQWEVFYKADKVIRKQIADAAKTIFPGIDLKQILGSLQVLGLFYTSEDRLIPDKKRFEDFASLSARERMEYCTAAMMVFSELTPSTDILPPLFRGKIKEYINFISGILDSINENFLYEEKTLKRLAEVIYSKMNKDIFAAGYHSAASGSAIDINLLLQTMEKTGLLTTASSGLKQVGSFPEVKEGSPSIAIDSGSSVIVYPEINFSDLLELAAFLNIKETGAAVRFEIEKDSAVRAFDNNISAEQIISILQKLSGGRAGQSADETLVWNIKDWEKRRKEVSLKKGVVLTLAEDRRYLTETMPLASLISETIAPGVYLLDENALEKAANALQNAGIDIIARRPAFQDKNFSSTQNYFPSPSSTSLSSSIVDIHSSKQKHKYSDSQALTKDFHAMLKDITIDKSERAELTARIDRRIVLCEEQLKNADVRYEKLEARHMDYMGKQTIAKQAISQKSPVEALWLSEGKEKSIFGIPKALEKEGSDYILVVEDLRIPLAKISLLRRIKKSIFET